MELKKVSPRFFVSGQLSVADVTSAAAQGIRSIVNNRPDGEEPTQPTSAELKRTAEALGLEYVALPIQRNKMTDAHIEAFDKLSRQMAKPILLFCRSGARSSSLLQASQGRYANPTSGKA